MQPQREITALFVFLSFITSLCACGRKIDEYIFPGNNVFPEGIAKHPSSPFFYSGGFLDGMLYRGHVERKELEPFINGSAAYPGFQPVGMKVGSSGRLFVAGATGGVFVFHTETRRLLHRFAPAALSGFFLNDLDVAADGSVYISDSYLPVLWRITAAESDRSAVEQELKPFVDLSGVVDYQRDVINGNGVVVTPDQGFVLLGDYNDRKIYRVGIRGLDVRKIDFDREIGGPDGFLMRGDVLYSVNGNTNLGLYVDVIKISAPYSRGIVVGRITSSSFVSPSTMAFDRSDLLVPQFQYPALPTPPELPFKIVRVDSRYWSPTITSRGDVK